MVKVEVNLNSITARKNKMKSVMLKSIYPQSTIKSTYSLTRRLGKSEAG